MPEYPTFAWQEALVDAVAHRDCNEQRGWEHISIPGPGLVRFLQE